MGRNKKNNRNGVVKLGRDGFPSDFGEKRRQFQAQKGRYQGSRKPGLRMVLARKLKQS